MPSKYIPIIPTIDLRNLQTCLTCPLPDCVYEVESLDYRALCPVWRREAGQRSSSKRRVWARRNVVNSEV